MDLPNHHEHPELWFRPSPTLPFDVLSKSLAREELTVTHRLGKRDGTHPKGYVPGMIVTVRLFDDIRRERMRTRVRIVSITSKPLSEFDGSELGNGFRRAMDWQSLQRDFAFFEGIPIEPDELVSSVEFTYLNHEG